MGQERLLGGLDMLARMLIERATPVRFDVASSAAEQRPIFGLRYETVVVEGWGYANLCGTASGWRLERCRQFGLPLRLQGSRATVPPAAGAA